MSRSNSGYHHGSLAESLERAAMELLETHSAADLSLREVARTAGVSHNAPYHHFSGKNDLLKTLAERSMAELVASQRRSLEGVDPNEHLRSMLADYVRFAVARPHLFAAIYDPTICVPGQPTPAMAVLIAEEEQLLSDTARDARPELPDTRAFAAAAWGLAHGLAQLAQVGHLPQQAVDAAIDAFVVR